MRNYLPIARATLPFTSSKDQSVAKKTKIFPTENLATIDTTSSSEAKIDKVKPRRASTRSKTVVPSKKGARKTRSSVAAAAMAGPTDEEIRIRAYFISERRRRFALPGDANSDWIEAKRQLLSEIGPR
jgi:hypothetical protein